MPDNCCGNGCKNCVWDAYFKELEEYNNLYSPENMTKLAEDKLEPSQPKPQPEEQIGEKRNAINQLDNPLLNTMNESQHEESHVEGSDGRVHYYHAEHEKDLKKEREADKKEQREADKEANKEGQREGEWISEFEVNEGDKYMDFRRPIKKANPYLYSLYYNRKDESKNDKEPEK